ncbi:MAG: germination protein YpeB, partial [Alphaproteobacteria bacterium]|nr:germination protein YpeB [Alphaproteobacteria bacterium]
KLSNGTELYIQVTKNGGKVLTISGFGDSGERQISLNEAITKVKEVINKQTGIMFDCVWSDVVSNDAYLNFAPVQAGVVLYPDLIKAKVDLASGNIIGYSASAYYTNHTPRVLQSATYDKSLADAKIPTGFKVESSRLCVAPLDYGTEKLCYEYKCTKDDATYYIYINAQDGTTENILKVIETTDGNKLM